MTRRRPRPRKIITRVIVFLLLGAIVNVAVAWTLASSVDATSSDPELISEMGRDATRNWWVARHRTHASLWIAAMIQLHSTDALIVADSRIPNWSRIKHLPAYSEGDSMPMLQDFAFGWPALSMWYAIDAERDWQSGAVISKRTRGAVQEFGLPLWLLWPGFAINTIFYAATLWLLFFAPGNVRRTLRRRRGLCPACAYPVGTSPVCTECGKVVAVSLKG